jgi:hypothetical protein
MQGTSLQERLDIVSKKVENQRCCDCFDTQPRFASIIATLVGDRIGAVLCFQCSRVHDDLGTDLCYVLNISNVEECKCLNVNHLLQSYSVLSEYVYSLDMILFRRNSIQGRQKKLGLWKEVEIKLSMQFLRAS